MYIAKFEELMINNNFKTDLFFDINDHLPCKFMLQNYRYHKVSQESGAIEAPHDIVNNDTFDLSTKSLLRPFPERNLDDIQ